MKLKRKDRAAEGNGATTEDELFAELMRLLESYAHAALRRRRTPTLQTSDLVNEAACAVFEWSQGYVTVPRLKYLGARAIRQVLAKRAERKATRKRAPAAFLKSLDEDLVAEEGVEREKSLIDDIDGIRMVETVLRGVEEDLGEECLQIIEGRYFGDMSEEELAEALGRSVRTVQRRRQTIRDYVDQRFGLTGEDETSVHEACA